MDCNGLSNHRKQSPTIANNRKRARSAPYSFRNFTSFQLTEYGPVPALIPCT